MPLKRTLNLVFVSFYGLGTIIGAGIYALIGSVAQQANEYTTVSFLLASLIAFFTAASYAELSSRFPESSGSALYVLKAFNKKWLSGVVGWLIVLTGIVSGATLVHGFINYLQLFFSVSRFVAIPVIILILGAISIWGITESTVTIVVMTLIEICGLLIIIWYGKHSFVLLNQLDKYIPPLDLKVWSGIFSGALIAFYAFIGFEDMVNLAEETKNPTRTIPYAILFALVGATFLYLLVSYVTVSSLSYKELMNSAVPLIAIIKQQGHSPVLFSLIAMVAITNGILVQIIVSSRLIYGMANIQNAPRGFAKIYEKTQIPLLATLVILLAIVIMAYWFPIQILAKITSLLMLFIFMMMHLSLIVLKLKNPKRDSAFSIPFIIPVIGIILLILFLLIQIF